MFICIQQFCKLYNQLSMQVNLNFVIKKTNEQHIENLKPDYKLLGISCVSRPTQIRLHGKLEFLHRKFFTVYIY
jgi:hypothetical protein